MVEQHSLFGSQFEEDFLVRTLGTIAYQPHVALTELVANAWDAGAASVDITIPLEKGGRLVVSDDGCGMTRDQFLARWMTLAYNRVKHQGDKAEFPSERGGMTRPAYGQNGVGRHGLLCFADSYKVETWRDGDIWEFFVATASGEHPFVLVSEQQAKKPGHGTKVMAEVVRRLPDPEEIRDILSARFLHDPQFVVKVNGISVPLAEHVGLIEKRTLQTRDGVSVDAFVIDTTKSNRNTRTQGVAFWVEGRLVGTPGWVIGGQVLQDGRTKIAKRYTVVARSNGLLPYVRQDWSGFEDSDDVTAVLALVADYVTETFRKLALEQVKETSQDALREHKRQLRELPSRAKYEVAEFVQEMTATSPSIEPEALSSAVAAVIKLEQSRSGAALLEKLTRLPEGDIDALDRLISEWSVRDALAVLDEIDQRLSVIEAIEKLSSDSSVNELHTLHPLVTQARWLFGPEFDSPEYASNMSLRNAVKKVFGKDVANDAFPNSKRRPDLVVMGNSTFSIVGTEQFDSGGTNLTQMRDVLIIELKKGGAKIGRDEMNQASGYVEDLLGCGLVDGTPFVRAYVVGHEIEGRTEPVRGVGENPAKGRIEATTYGQLVRTAHQRFFHLKEKVPARYEEMSGQDLLRRVLDEEPEQLRLDEKTGT